MSVKIELASYCLQSKPSETNTGQNERRTPQRSNILYAVAAIFFFIGFLGFQQYQNSHANSFNAAQTAKTNRVYASSQQKENAAVVPTQTLLSQAADALSKHDLSAEVGVLLQQQIEQWREQIIYTAEPIIPPQNPPSWSTSGWLAFGVGCVAAAAVAGFVGYVVLPGGGSVFLIGDEKRRQKRARKRRTLIGKGIVLTLILGIASSVIASFVHFG